jgi:hypothetical protein
LKLGSRKSWRPVSAGCAAPGKRLLLPGRRAGAALFGAFCRGRFAAGWCALAFLVLPPLHLIPAALAAPIRAAAPAAAHVPPAGLRHNEVRLARLEPGKDTLAAAVALFGPRYRPVFPDSPGLVAWVDRKHERVVRIDVNRDGVIETITLSAIDSLLGANGELVPAFAPQTGAAAGRPAALTLRRLGTGRGLALGDSLRRALELYGPPNSRGPSTRGSRALEFLFYAFDWAGPNVPQVMEVYCDARSGRVVEITLAAPTL